MGLVMGQVHFPEAPPTLEEIRDRLAGRSGLALRADPLPDSEGFYQLHGRLAFACAPEFGVELYCYAPDQRRRNVALFVDFGLVAPEALQNPIRPGSAVHLRSFIGMEPTLFLQTEMALEELGGTLREPFTEDVRQEYGRPLTEAELLRRIQDVQAAMRPVGWVCALLGPVLLAFHLVWVLVRLPWILLKARRLLRERGGFPFSLSDQEDVSEGITFPSAKTRQDRPRS
jgi:hypothetical protein